MAEDKISQLPEDLILKILSLVPIKNVVSTSVLSKEWKSRWKSVPKLKYNSEDYQSEHQTFSETVHKSLVSYEPKVLESFQLGFGSDKADAVDVVHWIKTAFALNLRTLVLEFLIEPFEVYEFVFPSCLCTCDTLETLELGSLIRVDLPAPGSMKSLKTLRLIQTFYTNDESICNLLSSCPRLEELIVERSYDYNFSLNAPELVEAYIGRVTNVISESIVSVRCLVLNVSTSEIYTHEPGWYDLLTWMLERSPKLQVLKLVGRHLCGEGYDWKREKEEEVATYILKNARGLKNATFTTDPIEPGQLDKLKQRCRTRKKLDGVLKTSKTCHLVFKFE
ncbi:F-box/FBD/LRR-repeat protein [Raphanus sativus]|nr:F-box/FBD/LRR-repeat protein [Raphanus sativus]